MRKLFVAAGLAGLLLGWNAPNHYPPWTTFHLELFAAIGVALLALATFGWPAIHARARVPTLAPAPTVQPWPRAARVWLLLALLPALQFIAGQLEFRGDALIGMLYALGVALSVYIGALWAAQEGSAVVLRRLWATWLAAGIIAGGLALVQWLRIGTPGWWAMELIDDRPFASLAQPNQFGLLMVMAIVALTMLFEAAAITRRWVWALALGFLGFGVLISQSRSAALALALVALLWLATRSRVASRLRLRDVAVAVVGAVVLAQLLGGVEEVLLLKGAAARATAEIGPREAIWRHAITAIGQQPWTGYGFNQGVMALAAVAGAVEPSRNVIFAHNVVLDLMLWFGVPLALAAVAALALWLMPLLRTTADPAWTVQRHGALALWLALVVQSLLEFPYAHAYFLLPAALLLGAVGAPAALATRAAAGVVRAGRVAVLIALLSLGLLLRLSWEYFRIEDDFRFNRFDRAQVGSRVEHDSLREPWVLDQLVALNDSARIEIVRGMAPEQIAALHRLARRFHILSTRLDYAKALALNGRMPEAERELQIIRSVYPPQQFDAIRRQWQQWLAAQAAQGIRFETAPDGRPASTAPPR